MFQNGGNNDRIWTVHTCIPKTARYNLQYLSTCNELFFGLSFIQAFS